MSDFPDCLPDCFPDWGKWGFPRASGGPSGEATGNCYLLKALIFLHFWILLIFPPPRSVLPISLYGVTIWLNVISSKSDKFFERHLPWSAFRSVHLRSVKSRLFFTVTSSRPITPRDDTNYPQAIEITGLLGRFGLFLLGVLQDERV